MTDHRTPEVDVDTVAAALTGADAPLLLDVREPAEYAEAHVPGAVLIPMSRLAERAGELDPATPVYVICASGHRSRVVTDALVGAGFDARNVAGGTMAWISSGHPVERGLP